MLRATVALAVLVFGISASVGLAQAPATPNVGPPGPPPNGEQLYRRTASSATAPTGMSCPTSISVTAAFAAPPPTPNWLGSCCAAFRTPRCRRTISPKRRPRRSSQYLRAKALPRGSDRRQCRQRPRDLHRQGQLHELSSRQRHRRAAGPGSERDWPAAAFHGHRARDRRTRLPHRAEQSIRAARHARRRDDHRDAC